MKKLIGSLVVAIGLVSFFGITHASSYPIQTQSFQISAAGASIGDTSLGIISFNNIATSSAGGIPITISQIGTVGFGVLEPGNGGQEESIEFTGITQNSNGSATLTGVTDCAMFQPYATTIGLTKSHAGASTFALSNTSCFYNSLFANLLNPNTITGLWSFTGPIPTVSGNATTSLQITNLSTVQSLIANATSGATTNLLGSTNTWTGINTYSQGTVNNGSSTFNAGATFQTIAPNVTVTPTQPNNIANKAYVDATAVFGAPISSNTIRGIGFTASSTQLNGINATSTPYFIPSNLASTTASTTSSIVVATNASTGLIDPSFLPATAGNFGSGIDGPVIISSTTTLNRDMFYTSLVVNNGAGIISNGYKIYANQSIVVNGIIQNNGNQGGNAVSGTSAGIGGSGGGGGTLNAGRSGGTGANGDAGVGTNGSSTLAAVILNSGASGGAGTNGGGAGGTGGTTTLETLGYGVGSFVDSIASTTEQSLNEYIQAVASKTGAALSIFPGAGGGGAGGFNSGSGGRGGGGGGGGGIVEIVSPSLTVGSTGFIQSIGGNGGTGGNGNGSNNPGGGGGGGNGGLVILIYKSLTTSGTISAPAGLAGVGGSGGNPGSNGNTGVVYKIKLN